MIKERTQGFPNDNTLYSENRISPLFTGVWLDYLLIIFIFLLFIINFYKLISTDTTPPKWDEAVHLRDSFVFYNMMSDPSQLSLTVIREIINKSDQYPLLRPSGYYPPLVPIITAFLFFMTGVSIKAALISNLIFILILILSVYQIGALLWDRNTGLLASILILFFPIVLNHSIIYYMDLPLTAFTALGIFTLLKTEFFSNTNMSAVSGFCFGLGMLTKWTFLFFIFGPFIYTISQAFRNSSEPNSVTSFRKVFKNAVLFGATSLITFGLYYFPILSELIKETFKYTGGPLSHGPESILSFDSIAFYFVSLYKEMITSFGFILFAAGVVLLTFSRNKQKIFILLSLIIPYIVFTFLIRSKTPRYLLPLLPVISLVVAFGIMGISSFLMSLRKFVTAGKYFAVLASIIFAILYYIEYLNLQDSIVTNSRHNWNVPGMINVIEKDLNVNAVPKIKKLMYLGTIPDHEYINGQTLRYYANVRRLPLNVIKLQDYTGDANKKFIEQFERYDYILTKNFSNIVKPEFQKSVNDMTNFFYSKRSSFELLKSFIEPDGSEVSIYRKR